MARCIAPAIMPILDAPSQRRVRAAVNIEDLRIAAERRAHPMVYGYLAGGADEERRFLFGAFFLIFKACLTKSPNEASSSFIAP